MNEIARNRIAERFAEAIEKDGLTFKQVSDITGINYAYVGKAASKHENFKAPQWVMDYLQKWSNTGNGIISTHWKKLAEGTKATPVPFIAGNHADTVIKDDLLNLDEDTPDQTIDLSEIKNLDTLPSSTVNNLKMLLEMRDKIDQTINELKTIIDKWEQ